MAASCRCIRLNRKEIGNRAKIITTQSKMCLVWVNVYDFGKTTYKIHEVWHTLHLEDIGFQMGLEALR